MLSRVGVNEGKQVWRGALVGSSQLLVSTSPFTGESGMLCQLTVIVATIGNAAHRCSEYPTYLEDAWIDKKKSWLPR